MNFGERWHLTLLFLFSRSAGEGEEGPQKIFRMERDGFDAWIDGHAGKVHIYSFFHERGMGDTSMMMSSEIDIAITVCSFFATEPNSTTFSTG